MGAIAGWMALPQHAPEDGAMAAVLEALAHRGPDDAGACAFQASRHRVVLGNRRLAIVDPQGARQPMCDAAAGVALTFNGEVYNFRELRAELAQRGHRFTLDSDTEVLLRAYQQWDTEVVHHLRGQFAFAVWDARKERLYLARDRFGEKPLYLCESGGSVFFASEAKGLLRIPGIRPEVDLQAVRECLAYRYVPGPRTLFAGIRKLGPASYAYWQYGRRREVRYWTPPDREPGSKKDSATAGAVPRFMEELEAAVKLQTASDAPLGAFLSGGLDSSIIVALASRQHPGMKTFSVGVAGQRHSGLPYAAQVAKEFGTAHHEMVVSQQDLMGKLAALVACRDAPVAEPSDIPLYMLACEAARSVKVVLNGEGSDELLGGHSKHVLERYAWSLRLLPRAVRRGLIAPLGVDDWRERYVRWFGALDRAECDRLAGPALNGAPVLDARLPFDAASGASRLRRALYFDQVSWLPDNLLERGERATMAASIEARAPFLDHRLAEYVSALPDTLRVRGLRTKWILRQAGRSLIPRRIRRRPKAGLRLPVNQWFRGEMRAVLLEHLAGSSSLTRPYYNAGVLDRVMHEHLKGRQNHEKLLWMLLNLEIWHRTYRNA